MMKSLDNTIITKIAEAKDKTSLMKLILVLIKNKADTRYIQTALNKLLIL